MAQLSARPLGAPTPSLPGGGMPSGGRNVAAINGPPIEEISAKAGVEAENNFMFQDFADDGYRRRRQASPPIKNTAGMFETPSSTFAYYMAQNQENAEQSRTPRYGTTAFRNVLSRAIHAYEKTAMVISGATSQRGASYSMSL